MTRFSIMTGIDPAKPATDIIEYAKATERHGFDTLWIWDTWFSTDAFVTMALAAANTERIGLANGVAATPVRHPSMLVNSIAAMQDVSSGRAILGVGCGGQATVGRLGMRKARIAEFRRDLKTMRTLLDGGEIKEDGANYCVQSTQSLEHYVPLYTAAWGPRMLEASAQLADGIIIMGPDQKDVLKVKVDRIRRGAEAAGRDPAEVKIVLGITCDYADDPSEIVDKYKSLAIHYMQRVGYEDEYPADYRALLDRIREEVPTIAYPEWEEPKWHLVPDDFVKYQLTVGTEAECIARIEELMTLEPDEIMFSSGFAHLDQVTKYAALVSRLKA